ncbi:MAG: hypothetical protein FWE05_05815 [Defluviitaleaceae bacterium]|nr:hypothetical protein [Defluviitaleaceae bacterium]
MKKTYTDKADVYEDICKLTIKKKSMISSPDDVVRMAGPKAAQILYNIFHIGPRVILRSAFELLRANTITRILSAVILLVLDTVSLVRKRISIKQFVINVGLALSMTIGGTAGWMLGQETVAAILIQNALLGILISLIGAGIFGAGLGMLWEKIIGLFLKDDTHDMMEILNQEFVKLSREHMLTEKEIETLKETIAINQKIMRDIYVQHNRQHYVHCMLEPYIMEIVNARDRICN